MTAYLFETEVGGNYYITRNYEIGFFYNVFADLPTNLTME